jgi:hypothetical protein
MKFFTDSGVTTANTFSFYCQKTNMELILWICGNAFIHSTQPAFPWIQRNGVFFWRGVTGTEQKNMKMPEPTYNSTLLFYYQA